MHYDCRLTLFESHPKYIFPSMIYFVLRFTEYNGMTIFDFLTNRTNVHEAHITYPLPSPTLYILVVRYQGFTRVDHSKTTQSNFSSSGTILQGRFRLSRFERFTYDVSTHTCARSFLAFTFFFLPARMFVSRARNRSDRTWLYNDGGLRTSALEDFIEGFPKSRRRS